MATLNGLLASLLNPNPGAGGLLSPGGYLGQTGLGPEQLARYHQQSGLGQQAPQTPSAPPPGASGTPKAPTQPGAAPSAPAPSGGGGIGDFLGNLLAPKSAQRNKTVQLLMQDGLDEGTATLYAGNKQALQQYLMQRSQGTKPLEVNGRLVDPNTFQVLADFSDGGKRSTATIDGKLVDTSTGQVIGDYGDDSLLTPEEEAQKIRLAQAGAARSIGTPPVGYQIQYDGNGNPVGMTPIPGGPAAIEAEAAANQQTVAEQNRSTSTDVVTGAANTIRELAGGWSTGLPGAALSVIPSSDAAEIARQMDVLKANATVENLTAMRAASPTGGALGAVSDRENAMLSAKAGALDPKSPRFLQQLDDYERTLYRIIHGPQGDQLFEQSRQGSEPAPGVDLSTMPAPEGIDPKVWEHVPPERRKLWQ